MATDVEESDTDEYERPVPSKRQCTRYSRINRTCWNMEQHTSANADDSAKNNDHDKVERRLRDKLKRWQAFQAASGALDNTVNKVLEDMMLPSDRLDRGSIVSPVASRLRLFQKLHFPLHSGDYMEDRAVMTAIRNHGLVKSAKLISQSHDEKAPPSGCRTDSEYIGVYYPSISGRAQPIKSSLLALPTTSSSEPPRLINSLETGRCNTSDLDADKVYDSDQPEDFLERAVAEAIKKKGLSALSVKDY